MYKNFTVSDAVVAFIITFYRLSTYKIHFIKNKQFHLVLLSVFMKSTMNYVWLYYILLIKKAIDAFNVFLSYLKKDI